MVSQKDIEEEKEKILAIIDSLTDGLMVFDEEGKLSLINPAAQKIFEIEKEILGRSIVEFLNFPNLKNLFYLLGKEIKEVFRKELEIRKNLILEVTSLPILKEEKKFGNLVILHDITREKTIERMKIEFVSISAHQFRTPLSAIRWSLETLSKEKLGKLTEGQKEIVGKAQDSNERMLTLIDDLLDVVSIEEGRRLYKPTFSELEKVIQSVTEYYQEEIRKKQIKFEFQVPSEKLPKIKIDTAKIVLAVKNLLDNAIKYTLPGGMITIALKSTEKEIEFSIEDTGIGIPEDQQQNVFKKFFRGSNAVKIETEGNGLGLFIVKNIIEAHNGKIWFQSEEGEGTTCYFNLPLK
jgi:PAS domain S-box-containing protein